MAHQNGDLCGRKDEIGTKLAVYAAGSKTQSCTLRRSHDIDLIQYVTWWRAPLLSTMIAHMENPLKRYPLV